MGINKKLVWLTLILFLAGCETNSILDNGHKPSIFSSDAGKDGSVSLDNKYWGKKTYIFDSQIHPDIQNSVINNYSCTFLKGGNPDLIKGKSGVYFDLFLVPDDNLDRSIYVAAIIRTTEFTPDKQKLSLSWSVFRKEISSKYYYQEVIDSQDYFTFDKSKFWSSITNNSCEDLG